ncbi:unnamed protein product [Dovyalis caffra]|uniref:Uncharacterized protein n=1 Tax=Dovyalis caffra TaxID=77055 RepID=A0AAV1S9J7_9ROSI|nr:unnamed protein product [Dovyalis caffra]
MVNDDGDYEDVVNIEDKEIYYKSDDSFNDINTKDESDAETSRRGLIRAIHEYIRCAKHIFAKWRKTKKVWVSPFKKGSRLRFLNREKSGSKRRHRRRFLGAGGRRVRMFTKAKTNTPKLTRARPAGVQAHLKGPVIRKPMVSTNGRQTLVYPNHKSNTEKSTGPRPESKNFDSFSFKHQIRWRSNLNQRLTEPHPLSAPSRQPIHKTPTTISTSQERRNTITRSTSGFPNTKGLITRSQIHTQSPDRTRTGRRRIHLP